MGWTIGKHRVEVKANGVLLSLLVDDEKPKPIVHPRILGDFPIQVGERAAILRRVRNLDVARTELWIGDTRVPQSLDSLVQKLAPKNVLCAGRHPESFRAPAAPAKYMCPTCRTLLCTKCVAVDRVRCAACFEAADHADDARIKALRVKGALIGVGIGVVVALVGLAIGVGKVVGVGFAAILLVVFKVIQGYVLERREAKHRDRLASRTRGP